MKIHLHDGMGYGVCGREVPRHMLTVHIEVATCKGCVRTARARMEKGEA